MSSSPPALGFRKCSRCEIIKPLDQFSKREGKTAFSCAECRNHVGKKWCASCKSYQPNELFGHFKTCERCREKQRTKKKVAGRYYAPVPTFISTAPPWHGLRFDCGVSPFSPLACGLEAAFAVELSMEAGRQGAA